jgi:heterodisulfide reductase subunit A
VDTTLFYMDMRSYGKAFQRYRDGAESEHQVKFERARIHTVSSDPATGDPVIRYVRMDGSVNNETFDLVVLSVGQRPSPGNQQLAALTDVPLNHWGFVETEPFFPAATKKAGVLVGGSFSGLKDIGESVIHASAAALEASRVLHASGGSLAIEPKTEPELKAVSREDPRILVAVCSCRGNLTAPADGDVWTRCLQQDPCVERIVFLEHACTQTGWEELTATARETAVNRVLLAACHPYLFVSKLKEMARALLLDPVLLDAVDIRLPQQTLRAANPPPASAGDTPETAGLEPRDPHDDRQQLSAIAMALSRLKHAEPLPMAFLENHCQALVVGGGIAGMHASLAIADHGFPVTLVEQEETLGGNLAWLNQTIEGHSMAALLEETVQKIENHPLVEACPGSTISASFGEAGNFFTTVTNAGGASRTIQHATTILATGGSEASTRSYGYGDHPAIITQKELEWKIGHDTLETDGLRSVVMIQCVDSREEPRNYCSRVCCPTSLKHALNLKEIDPDLAVYILYRDMMTTGFLESSFTRAREKGIFFIQYDPENRPGLVMPASPQEPLYVSIVEPLLGRPLEIRADLLVLATGIAPQLPPGLAALFGAQTDQDGFFKEADAKWRPVDALKEGVFACGIALSPRPVPDAVASAQAAAQRSLKILSKKRLPTGKIVSTVRHSICSRCGRCVDTCPYGARSLDIDNDRILVNPITCQGCGDCAAVCPNGAAVVRGFADHQVLDMIDAALD